MKEGQREDQKLDYCPTWNTATIFRYLEIVAELWYYYSILQAIITWASQWAK